MQHPSPDAQRPPVTVVCEHCGQDSVPAAADRDLTLAYRCTLCGFERAYARITVKGAEYRKRLRLAFEEFRRTRDPRVLQKARRLETLVKRHTIRL